jgi:DeoR/GlpR family transcriptional regulator of sugar metabolism
VKDPVIIGSLIAGIATLLGAIITAIISHRKSNHISTSRNDPGHTQYDQKEIEQPKKLESLRKEDFHSLVKETERLADLQTEQANSIFRTLYDLAGDGEWVTCERIAQALGLEEGCEEDSLHEVAKVIDLLIRGGQLPGVARDGDRFRITEQYYTLKLNQLEDEKRAIAIEAVQHLRSGDLVIVDAGSTTLAIVDVIAERIIEGDIEHISIVTNSPVHLNKLLEAANKRGLVDDKSEIKLFMLGGRVRLLTRAAISENGLSSMADELRKIVSNHASRVICFVGANGIDPVEGYTTQTEEEAENKRLFIDLASNPFVVADAVKFGKSWESCFAEPTKLLTLITCAPAQGRQEFDFIVQKIRNSGANVIALSSIPVIDRP